LEKVFRNNPSKQQSILFDTFDYTMTVQDIVELFEVSHTETIFKNTLEM